MPAMVARRRSVLAVEDLSLQRQALEVAHRRIVAGEDDTATGFFQQQPRDAILPPGHRRGQGLEHEHLVVAIDDEAGQLVRFRPDETPGGTARIDAGAQVQRVVEAQAEQAFIQWHDVPRVAPGDDLRALVVNRAAKQIAPGGTQFHGLAINGLPLHPRHFAGENPGVSIEDTMPDALV